MNMSFRVILLIVCVLIIVGLGGGCMSVGDKTVPVDEEIAKVDAIQNYLEEKYGIELTRKAYNFPKKGFNPNENESLTITIDFALKDQPNLRFWASELLNSPGKVQDGYLEARLGQVFSQNVEQLHEQHDLVQAGYHSIRVNFTDINNYLSDTSFESLDFRELLVNQEFSFIDYLAIIQVSKVEDVQAYLPALFEIYQELRTYGFSWYSMEVGFVENKELFIDYVENPGLYAVNGLEYESPERQVFGYIKFNDTDGVESFDHFVSKLKYKE